MTLHFTPGVPLADSDQVDRALKNAAPEQVHGTRRGYSSVFDFIGSFLFKKPGARGIESFRYVSPAFCHRSPGDR
jgi:hypothetical protein